MLNDPQWVFIKGGKHKGKTLKFAKRTEKRVGVEVSPGKIVYLLPDHVESTQTMEAPTIIPNDEVPRVVSPIEMDDSPKFSKWVRITGGKHKGKKLRFVKRTQQRVAVELADGTTIYLVPDHVKNLETEQDPMPSETKEEINALVTHNHVPTPRSVSPEVGLDIPQNNTIIWVQITGGKHKGKKLKFVKRTQQRVAVELEDSKKIVYLSPDHVKTLVTEQSSQSFGEIAPVETTTMLDDVISYDFVSAGGSRGNESDFHEKDDNDSFASAVGREIHDEKDDDDTFASAVGKEIHEIDDDDETFASAVGSVKENLNSSSQIYIYGGMYAGRKATFVKNTPKRVAVILEGESKTRYLSPTSLEPGVCKMTEADKNDPMVQAILHHLPSDCCVQNVTEATIKRTLFGVIFAADKPVFFDVQTQNISKLPLSFVQQGQSFHLAAVKMHDKAKALTCSYILAPSREHVANRLMGIGSFDKLIPRKTGARLELLLSTASQDEYIHQINVSNFCNIAEKGNVGCGFIPRHMIDILMGIPSPQVCALQVRIVIPSMGIFKGILFEKQNIRKIELPSSMQKVNAAMNADMNVAWIMINKTGIYPYPARVQQAKNSFQDKKDISDMAQWMLKQKGVSQTYLQQPNGQFSFLLGVADPTDTIPSGRIFLSGIHDQLDNFGDKVIISRFPMTEASDGRVLPIVREKPHTMSTAQWDFLCSKPFGFVIFGNPAPGDRSMPEQIAQGDLDGDGYFVTWDRKIVQDAVIGDKAIFATKNPPTSLPTDWWSESQQYMANIEARKQSQKVIGKLHNCWLQNLRNGFQQDAVLFGRAFKNALDSAKHGVKISLPERLCSQIPRDLRYFLHPIPE